VAETAPPTLSEHEARRREAMLGPAAEVVATIGLPSEVRAASPELPARGHSLVCEPGLYEVVAAVDEAIMIRRAGARVIAWSYLDDSEDEHYVVAAATVDLDAAEYPEQITRDLAMDSELVWASNPAGDPVRAFVGRAASGNIVAIYLQFIAAA
jgi:hypothetical protein